MFVLVSYSRFYISATMSLIKLFRDWIPYLHHFVTTPPSLFFFPHSRGKDSFINYVYPHEKRIPPTVRNTLRRCGYHHEILILQEMWIPLWGMDAFLSFGYPKKAWIPSSGIDTPKEVWISTRCIDTLKKFGYRLWIPPKRYGYSQKIWIASWDMDTPKGLDTVTS